MRIIDRTGNVRLTTMLLLGLLCTTSFAQGNDPFAARPTDAQDPIGGAPTTNSGGASTDPFGGSSTSGNNRASANPFGSLTEPPSKSKESSLPVFSEAREAAALVFVKQHCPKLLKPLEEYKKLNVSGYHKAIRQFFLWSEMSTEGQLKDSDGLELALKGSQATIESQLLSAKLMRDPTQVENLKEDLRRLIENSVDLQIAQAERQLASAKSQLETMLSQLHQLHDTREKTIDDRLASLEKMVAQQINLSNVSEEVKQAIQQLQEAARQKAAEGYDVSHISKGMQRIEILIREGKTDLALNALRQGLEYLKRQNRR